MGLAAKLDQLHFKARQNRWLGFFAIFNRIALAAGFIPSGLQKVLGERFTVLSSNHPMGNYLDAVYHTGYYYTTIGIFQVLAAILLLIPRTATLGAIIYFPIILNITILSLAVRFDGSLFSSPLMLLACTFLLCWDYHKFRTILSNKSEAEMRLPKKEERNFKFPFKFALISIFLCALIILHSQFSYEIMPRNSISACKADCVGSQFPEACEDFCNCIHQEGNSLDSCLIRFEGQKHE